MFTFLKNESNILEKIDLNQNAIQDEGMMYLSVHLRACNNLNSIVKIKCFNVFKFK